MGQVIQVNGDYNIKAKVGSKITLDTGVGVGETRITGNLVVEGATLTVSTQDLKIRDNIIILNDGDDGPGVTLRYSGLQINRGAYANNENDVYFLFDENDNTWNFLTKDRNSGLFDSRDANLRLATIKTDPNRDTSTPKSDFGNLNVIGTGTGVINVSGTTAYEVQVETYGDDAIPNKKYVDDAIQNSPSFQIKQDDTRVLIADLDVAGRDYLNNLVLESEIAIIVDDVPNSTFYGNRAMIQRLEFAGTEISNNDTSTNIYLRTTGTGKIQTNYAVQLEQLSSNPVNTSGFTHLFARAPSTGDTGLYFSASGTTASPNGRHEIISTNRALLYSMLF